MPPSQRAIRRRLGRVHAELATARSAVTVAELQLAAFDEDAEETHVRSLVSENRDDLRTSSMAARHREVMQKALDRARRRVSDLAEKENELLQRIEL